MLVLTLDQVIDFYRGKTKTIRKQHCMSCKTVLAIQSTDKIESSTQSEFWKIVGGMVVKGEFEAHYQRSGKWFGDYIKCPRCGREGKLPIDKPYSWEEMKKQREAQNV